MLNLEALIAGVVGPVVSTVWRGLTGDYGNRVGNGPTKPQ